MAIKRKDKQLYTCAHCEKEFDFPVDYCHVCEDHVHKVFMSRDTIGVCSHCLQGGSKKAREYWRSKRMLKPSTFDSTGWDWPEWYDLDSEWRNTTIDFVWQRNEYGIEEV